ncbi:hypothetical protein C8A00DRAFT_44508 [Chaetomidium leptoderma]|uniref:Uncharacterized protein n=1 Tax=Chaetomidium leptoderma TaxID=669021 RepID=A0AAN6VJ18_9PEZI|nr:hypothetical protein C8A00DRAFT_44508 [Chaetomidium leptoderma]
MSSHAAPTTVPFTIDNAISGMRAFSDSPDVYRIRIQPEHATQGGPMIKYLAAPNTSKTLTGPDAHIRRRNNLAFDRVPAGGWVVAQLTVADDEGEPQQGKLKFASIEADTTKALHGLGLASAEPTWCGKTVDKRECRPKDDSPGWTATVINNTPAGKEKRKVHFPKPTPLQCMDYISASLVHTPTNLLLTDTHPAAASSETAILVKDWLPGHWAGISNESRTRQIIAERGGPGPDDAAAARARHRKRRPDGKPGVRASSASCSSTFPDAREAGIADLAACRAVLTRLHAAEGVVVGLEEALKQSPSDFEDQEADMLRLVDPQRVEILEAFQRVHGVVLPFVYWQESREGGGRITLSLEEHGVLVKEYEENGLRWTRELQEKAEERFGPSAKGHTFVMGLDETCSDCWLGGQALQLNNPLGYDEALPSNCTDLYTPG